MIHEHEERNVSIAIIGIVAALGVLGLVVVTVATVSIQLQEAEAQRGCSPTNPAFNASQGRCFRG
jgi:hypothetical protein